MNRARMILSMAGLMVAGGLMAFCLYIVERKFDLEPLAVGSVFPAFEDASRSLQRISRDGEPAIMENKKIAVVFFSADCDHCARELSNYETIHRLHKEDIEIYGVTLSEKRKTELLASKLHLTFPLL